MKKLLLTCAIGLLAAPAIAAPADPETLVCPPTSGDLEYGLRSVMVAANFEAYPYEHGVWRRREDGPFHLRSAENASWIVVEFTTYRTQAGTRLIAEPFWETSRYRYAAQGEKIISALQATLDGLAAVWPCAPSKHAMGHRP